MMGSACRGMSLTERFIQRKRDEIEELGEGLGKGEGTGARSGNVVRG